MNLDALLHPARLLIVQALMSQEWKSAGDLNSILPEMPQASLYRHLKVLRRAGVLEEQEGENHRGRRELKYRMVDGAANPNPQQFMELGHDGRMAVFTQFLAQLQTAFREWSVADSADPLHDGVGFRQAMLWLNDQEFREMSQELGEVFSRYHNRAPNTGDTAGGMRRLRSISTIVLPRTLGYSNTTEEETE